MVQTDTQEGIEGLDWEEMREWWKRKGLTPSSRQQDHRYPGKERETRQPPCTLTVPRDPETHPEAGLLSQNSSGTEDGRADLLNLCERLYLM